MTNLDPTLLFEVSQRAFVEEYSSLAGELEALRDRRKAMSVFTWSISDIDDNSSYLKLVNRALMLGLAVTNKLVRRPDDSIYVVTYVLHHDNFWRVSAHHLLLQLLTNPKVAWTDELERMESMLLGYTEDQIETWMASKDRLGVSHVGRSVYAVLSEQHVLAIQRTGQRCLPLEMEGGTLTVVLPRGGLAPSSAAFELVTSRGLVLARLWVMQSLYERILSDFRFDDGNTVMIKSMALDNLEEINYELMSDVEFLGKDGWV